MATADFQQHSCHLQQLFWYTLNVWTRSFIIIAIIIINTRIESLPVIAYLGFEDASQQAGITEAGRRRGQKLIGFLIIALTIMIRIIAIIISDDDWWWLSPASSSPSSSSRLFCWDEWAEIRGLPRSDHPAPLLAADHLVIISIITSSW